MGRGWIKRVGTDEKIVSDMTFTDGTKGIIEIEKGYVRFSDNDGRPVFINKETFGTIYQKLKKIGTNYDFLHIPNDADMDAEFCFFYSKERNAITFHSFDKPCWVPFEMLKYVNRYLGWHFVKKNDE